MPTNRRTRVLLIVDSLYWATANFARQVVADNPRLEAVICSQYMIRQFLKRFKRFPLSFDLVHFLNTKTMEPFCGRLPVVTTLHHVDSRTRVDYLDDSDAVMTVSGQWHHYLLDLGIPREKVWLVPFAVDHQTFQPATHGERLEIRRALNIPGDAVVIGFSGRRTSDVDGRKGMDCLVDGLKKMQHAYSNVMALIVGPGWKELISRLNRESIDSVHIPYQLDHGNIARTYRALDMYWVTSRIEGGPVPLLEAMASGIPCLSTPVGAALDLVEDKKNGLIVPFDRPDIFVERALELLSNRDMGQKMGEAARATIVQERPWERTKVNLSQLYEGAIKNFQPRRMNFGPLEFAQENPLRESVSLTVDLHACFDEFGPKIGSWMKACEYVRGSKMLIQLDEWPWALRLLGRALTEVPGDINMLVQTASMLLREGRKKVRRLMKKTHGSDKVQTVKMSKC